MINQVFQLVAPRQISIKFEDVSLNTDRVIVRPTYLSICAADQRYYTGQRDPLTYKKKLPMALIHEATGGVIHDPAGEFRSGDRVLLIPNTPTAEDEVIAENYRMSSRFRASGFDGFLQEYVLMDRDRLVHCDAIPPEVAAVCELISVAVHSVDSFLRYAHDKRDVIGIWGDGNLGYMTALILTKKLPGSRVVVFGVHPYKLGFFSFAHDTFHVDQIPDGLRVDHAFECVGGQASQNAIEQIISRINPEGTVMLTGVSENPVQILTRMVLERGLHLIGRSRSGRADFLETVRLFGQFPDIPVRIRKIIREVVEVRDVAGISRCFEEDLTQPFKTVMKWNV